MKITQLSVLCKLLVHHAQPEQCVGTDRRFLKLYWKDETLFDVFMMVGKNKWARGGWGFVSDN